MSPRQILDIVIRSTIADGTARTAFQHGHAIDKCFAYVGDGTEERIAVGDLSGVFVEALDATPVACIVQVSFLS